MSAQYCLIMTASLTLTQADFFGSRMKDAFSCVSQKMSWYLFVSITYFCTPMIPCICHIGASQQRAEQYHLAVHGRRLRGHCDRRRPLPGLALSAALAAVRGRPGGGAAGAARRGGRRCRVRGGAGDAGRAHPQAGGRVVHGHDCAELYDRRAGMRSEFQSLYLSHSLSASFFNYLVFHCFIL